MHIKIKRLFSLLLVIIILFSNSQIAHALTDEINSYNLEYPVLYPTNGFSYPDLMNSAGPNVETLEKTVDIDAFRNTLIEGFASCPSYVDISAFKIPSNTANWNAIKSYIWYETPELFHVQALGYSTRGGYFSSIGANYYYTAAQYSTMYQEFLNGADKLLSGIKDNNNLDDVEKALLLHDRIAVWCEYSNGSIPQESFNAYGVFAKQDAVCMGYTLAYDYLLRQVGIDSYYCSSNLLNHAWNIVIIDGNKYHVDVTWDDPTYDRSGRVRHVNFLRSSTGISSTGHNSNGTIDYDTSPASTTYDSYFWQNSDTAFQLVGDDIYYIDGTTKALNKISNNTTTVCKNIDARWWASSNSYWTGHYSLLSSDGKDLFYSLPSAVYKYDVATGTSSIIFEPDLSCGSYYSIYGFKYENCSLICEVYSTPNFQSNTKAENTQKKEYHSHSEWVTTKAPTFTTEGIKQKICTNCNKVIEEITIPAIAVTAKENTIIDYYNSLVFTDVFTCENINNLVSVSGTTTITFDSSKDFYGTGTLIDVLVDGEIVNTFTLIVNGDINGDSVCDVLDLAQAQLYASNKKTPDTLDIYAANCGIADIIDETTYQNLVNKALNI